MDVLLPEVLHQLLSSELVLVVPPDADSRDPSCRTAVPPSTSCDPHDRSIGARIHRIEPSVHGQLLPE